MKMYNNNFLELLTIFIFLLSSFFSYAQTTKLDYEPKNGIVEFHFQELTIYTDTTALFEVYANSANKGYKKYHARIRNLVSNGFKESKTDTAIFKGDLIPFKDDIYHPYQKSWYVQWAIIHLIEANKIKIFDQKGRIVKRVKKKKMKKGKNGILERKFINKDNREELFSEIFRSKITTPKF